MIGAGLKLRWLLAFAMLLAASRFASAEFTTAGKTEIQKINSLMRDAGTLVFYAGNALKRCTPERKDLCVNYLGATVGMYDELRIALNYALGLRSFAGQSQVQLNDDVSYRINGAKIYLSRALGGYKDGGVERTWKALVDSGDDTYELVVFADRTLKTMRSRYAAISLLPEDMADWKMPDWPFFVRRALDGAGVHGNFEQAKQHLAQGRGYIMSAMYQLLSVVSKMPYTPAMYGGVRNFTLGFRDTMNALADVHLQGFGVFVPSDPFARLLASNEDALVRGGSGARGLFMFSLRSPVRYMSEHGDFGTGAAENMAEAVEKLADGWGHAIDFWTWESLRFPCLESTAVGCAFP